MTDTEKFNPSWRDPPGNTIKDALAERGWSTETFADRLGMSIDYAECLLRGEVRVTAELATDLSRTLGSSPQFWLNREAAYRKPMK